jgi:glucose/mannose-6-phosphate isomerase
MLHTGNVHPQNEKRFEFSKTVIKTKTQHIFELKAEGTSTIIRSLYLINVIDWASYYLAEMNERGCN